MSEARVLSYAQLRDAMRAMYLGYRDGMEQAEKAKDARNKRPPEWFTERRGRLNEIEQAGRLIALIAENAEAFDAWKASLPPKRSAA